MSNQPGQGIAAAHEAAEGFAIAGAVAGYVRRQQVLRQTGDPHLANSVGTRFGIGFFLALCGGFGTPVMLLLTIACAQGTTTDPSDPYSSGGTNPFLFPALLLLLASIAALWGGIHLIRETKSTVVAAVEADQTPPPIPGIPTTSTYTKTYRVTPPPVQHTRVISDQPPLPFYKRYR